MELDTARKRWFSHGATGVLLFAAGVSLVFDAAFRRASEPVIEIWAAEGMMGLILMMLGLAFFGSSVRYLVHMDRIVEYSERRYKRDRKSKKRKSERGTRPLHLADSGDGMRLEPMKTGVV